GDHGCEYMTGGRVVILGTTGRNFAAGMSGGIAYIWDPANKFREQVNAAMVDLEPLVEPQDIDEVLHMITRHQEYTNSTRAAEILKDWPERIREFVKVIPGDYKMALQKMEEENAMKMQQNKAQARI
ncbi:MAG TPA: hypothetical protein DEA96_09995, partial [Leptospiraceae bacterium]|nr:hypothetical protein [Leptospiraceae bacterium]